MTDKTKYGFSEKTLTNLLKIFQENHLVESVILFGSRAEGNFREGSDIDLALVGEKLDMNALRKIELQLDNLVLPYHLDIVIYHKIREPALKEHIDENGVKLFDRGEKQ